MGETCPKIGLSGKPCTCRGETGRAGLVVVPVAVEVEVAVVSVELRLDDGIRLELGRDGRSTSILAQHLRYQL